MIIHILGKAGAGKTTLGKRLSKLPNTFVFYTDDIDDPNSLKLFSKYHFKTQKNIDAYFSELAKLDQKDIMKIIEKNKDKNIIITGFLFGGMDVKVDKGYYIKIDDDTHYQQFNLRTL
jgi:adenylate kinase family enzyme